MSIGESESTLNAVIGSTRTARRAGTRLASRRADQTRTPGRTARSSPPVANRIDQEAGWSVPAPTRYRWRVLAVAGGLTLVGRDARLALSWHIRGTVRTQRQPQKDCRPTRWRHGAGHGNARRAMRSRPLVSRFVEHLGDSPSGPPCPGRHISPLGAPRALGRCIPPTGGGPSSRTDAFRLSSPGRKAKSSGIVQYADARGPQPVRASDLQPSSSVRCSATSRICAPPPSPLDLAARRMPTRGVRCESR